MLLLLRALGFLAPAAVAVCAALLGLILSSPVPASRPLMIGAFVVSIVAGATTMALIAWSLTAWRLARIASALETTLESDVPVRVAEWGIPAERRLARAINAATGAFLQIEQRATHDRLTGVPNRDTLLTALSAEFERAMRHGRPLSVAFIDIDRFKPINDTYGHQAGDAVLRQIASLIGNNVRASDVFGRYGGEEFMLILPETSADDALVLAEKLRELVMRQPLAIAPRVTADVTISIGVAGSRAGDVSPERLVDTADAAMYVAKSEGRNRTHAMSDPDDSAGLRRAPMSSERQAAAAAIGQWASANAAQALASVLAPQPHHRGAPSDMIANLATGVAVEMGLSRTEIDRIRIAALLHDLGKLTLPTALLDKPTALTELEWQTVGEHPRIGQVILEQATSLREAVPVVLHHHERFDGTGYPHGLKAHEIPMGARIVAVADAYHAMVHQRPYRRARTHDAALRELRRNAGTQFDPKVVEVFCAIFGERVPADGLEQVIELGEKAAGGIERIDAGLAAMVRGRPHRHPEPDATGPVPDPARPMPEAAA